MVLNHKNYKETFSELRDKIFEQIKDIKISSLTNINIIEVIKTLKIIELDNLESFLSYVNYDHYLIFKFNDDYYFCDTELVSSLKLNSMIKITDFNHIFIYKIKINHENNKKLFN